jgi:plasmid maintenance system antidote protein VapI
MSESEPPVVRPSNSSVEQPCKFGTVVRALWPDKPALNLAQRMGVSERNALQIIRGERRVTAKAVHAVVGEFVR